MYSSIFFQKTAHNYKSVKIHDLGRARGQACFSETGGNVWS